MNVKVNEIHLNHKHANWIYSKHGWSGMNTDEYFERIKNEIVVDCEKLGIECRSVY